MNIDELYQVMLEVLLNSYLVKYQKPFSYSGALGNIWKHFDNNGIYLNTLSIYTTRYELKSSKKLIIIHKYIE